MNSMNAVTYQFRSFVLSLSSHLSGHPGLLSGCAPAWSDIGTPGNDTRARSILSRLSNTYLAVTKWAMLERQVVQFTLEGLMLAGLASVVFLG